MDFPYPPGVRRDEVRHQNSSEMSEQSVIDDLYNLTESDVASTTEYVYDRSHISYPEGSTSGEMSGNDEGALNDNINVVGSASGEIPREEYSDDSNYDVDNDLEEDERDSISYPESSGKGGTTREEVPDDDEFLDDGVMESDDDGEDTFAKKSMLRTKKFKAAKRRIPSVAKKSVVVDNNSDPIKKKVQVAAEETATQRVQVNAGYENPEIPCLGSGCSGVLLKWVLTFYGTEN